MWDKIIKNINLLQISNRTSFIISFTGWIVFFLFKFLLFPIDIEVILHPYIPYVLLFTILCSLIFIAGIIYDFTNNNISPIKSSLYKKYALSKLIRNLSSNEKSKLRVYLTYDTNSHLFDPSDGIVAGLVDKGLLYQSEADPIPGEYRLHFNILQEVFELLKKHPELLIYKSTENN